MSTLSTTRTELTEMILDKGDSAPPPVVKVMAYNALSKADQMQYERDHPEEAGRAKGGVKRLALTDLDKQGRMVIPAGLLEHASLGREVTVAGVFDHLEIWDRAKWRQQLHEVEGSAEDVAERLAN